MKANKLKSDREKKEILKTFRVDESKNKEIKDNPLTIPELIDIALLVTKDEDFQKIRRIQELETENKLLDERKFGLESEIQRIDKRMINNEIEMEELKKTVKEKEFDLAKKKKHKDIDNSIQRTLDYYFKVYNPDNNPLLSFDDFMIIKETYVKSQASRCGLEEEEFTKKLLKAYEESLVQQVLI